MKKNLYIAGSLILFICSAFTIIRHWKVDSEHSSVRFNLPMQFKQGSFGNLTAQIEFDEANLPASRINASIDVNTINTGDQKHDDHLKSPDFFDAEKYPSITFNSTEILKTETGYLAKGKLKMKDSLKPVEIPFTYVETGKDKATFSGTMSINAGEYGVLKANKKDADKVIIYLVVPVTE